MAPGRVRLRDVAEAAGVSSTTASFVLNGRCSSIPVETQERVIEAAKRLYYRPHQAARALATGKTRRIGIVLNDPASFSTRDTYFSQILEGIIRRATEHDRNVLLLSARYSGWHTLYADVTSGAVDGVLQISRFADDELTPALITSGFPHVCVSFHVQDDNCVSVDCDNEAGGHIAARHLVDMGHRRIAVLYPGSALSWGAERLAGIRRGLEESGIALSDDLVLAWDEQGLPSRNWVRSAVKWLTTLVPAPTAVICCDEMRACMFAEMLPGVGITVPGDLSVISFNSTEVSERCTPSLTSVRQALKDIGSAAVDLLLARIRRQPVPEPIVRFPMELDVRESCASPRDMDHLGEQTIRRVRQTSVHSGTSKGQQG